MLGWQDVLIDSYLVIASILENAKFKQVVYTIYSHTDHELHLKLQSSCSSCTSGASVPQVFMHSEGIGNGAFFLGLERWPSSCRVVHLLSKRVRVLL